MTERPTRFKYFYVLMMPNSPFDIYIIPIQFYIKYFKIIKRTIYHSSNILRGMKNIFQDYLSKKENYPKSFCLHHSVVPETNLGIENFSDACLILQGQTSDFLYYYFAIITPCIRKIVAFRCMTNHAKQQWCTLYSIQKLKYHFALPLA